MNIKKALIPAAGMGTRRFPITKTIQKEMLPILNRPAIDYVVDECIKAGIEEIVFVINPNDTQIRHFYTENVRVHEYLEKMGKLDRYQLLKDLHTKARFSYIFQDPDDSYGTAVPVLKARSELENEEAFVVVMSDNFIHREDGGSNVTDMVRKFKEHPDAVGLASFYYRSEYELEKYGVAILDGDRFKGFIEKPEYGTAPSNYVNISQYIFTPKVFDYLEKQEIDPVHGELLLTDTVVEMANDGEFIGHKVEDGEYVDVGTLKGWLAANDLFEGKS